MRLASPEVRVSLLRELASKLSKLPWNVVQSINLLIERISDFNIMTAPASMFLPMPGDILLANFSYVILFCNWYLCVLRSYRLYHVTIFSKVKAVNQFIYAYFLICSVDISKVEDTMSLYKNNQSVCVYRK
jgi:hypothetical protein